MRSSSATASFAPAYEISEDDLTSQELFELVASRDYEALSLLYARVGLRAVHHKVGAHRERAEEKTEDNHGGFWSSPGKRGVDQNAMYSQLLRELSLFVTQKEEVVTPAKKKTKVEVSADAERLLRNAVAAFSDARPPTNFVVYEASDETEQAAADPAGPPIFDGSVANATPQTGGAGTILHLSCALDEPLCLAMGLAMGADARACHTAFRRLMIHEAACNGSLQCLTLLLELGRQYGGSISGGDNDADARLPPRLSRHSSTGGSRTFELPFLPRRLDRSEIMAPLHLYASMPGATSTSFPTPVMQPVHPEPRPHRTSFLGKKKKHQGTNTTGGGADFLTLLQSFRLYARQVKAGELSELDAARKVLQLATLPESSQLSLARSCAFNEPPAPELALRHRGRHTHNSTTSDGHGNTPLHWAAFKNETECVSLLLRYGANPNARAHPSGWTPLHDAAYSNSKEAVELLVDAGAQVDARANSGATPLCFAAQEDAAQSAALLLERGADLGARCAGGRDDVLQSQQQQSSSRFSGYTPLHYCAHYNAKAAARILLQHSTAAVAMEIPDLNDRLPIHVAVARGSSAVLQELLHAGARVVTRSPNGIENQPAASAAAGANPASPTSVMMPAAEPTTPRQQRMVNNPSGNGGNMVVVSTPVSSPVLRSMIPSQPVTSSKPWNCLSQKSIDECRQLIAQAEEHWSPNRHLLFTPADRKAVKTLLLTGKRLEQSHGMFVDLWPQVLSFCGRGWFDSIDPSHAPTVLLPDGTATAATPSSLYYNTMSHPPQQQAESEGEATPNSNTDVSYDDSLSLPNL